MPAPSLAPLPAPLAILSPTPLLSALRAAADPTRFRILTLLLQGEHCVCEINSQLSLAQNLASHHLSILKKAGLVQDRRDTKDHRWVYYTLHRENLRSLFGDCLEIFGADPAPKRIPDCPEV